MKKTHPWMLFFLFLFFQSALLACTKKAEKIVFYQTAEETHKIQETKNTQVFEEPLTVQTTVPTIAVYLCGEVKNPGVYLLDAGSRLYQAIELAGGLTENAQAEAVNLARLLVDSEQIYIPNRFESASFFETTAASSNGTLSESDSLININQATVSDLMKLPGIGQVKAEAIVTYQNENGLFSSIEEIKNVPGIKEAVFEKIKGMITVF